ncbi:putative ribonuclease H-like domain-containing protein [Tanacetum coccineum]
MCVHDLMGMQHGRSDETSEILKNFIKEIENLVDKKLKIIMSDNGTEFKNKVMDNFLQRKRQALMAKEKKVQSQMKSAGTTRKLNAGISTQKEEINQDCIVMPIWKDASYFDSPSKDVGNGEPNSVADDQKQVEDGPHNESDEKDKSEDDSSPKEVNVAGQHVKNFHHTLETTHVEFFNNKDKPEVDLGNITNSYTVPTTSNTRIHKDHPIKNVIGDVKSFIQTRRMTKSTSEQGFLSAVYEQKTHDTLNTCLYACFLSQIEPTSIAKALSDSSWVEAMQEELLQFKLQQVWKLVDLPNGKRAIRTKWVFRNKKDERGIMIRNKARYKSNGCEDLHSYMEPLRKRFMLLNHEDLKILTIQIKFTRWSRHFMGCIKLQEHDHLTKSFIHIDNESTICIVKNTVFHSKTKHIEIRHHFTRDSYEKKLIQVIKIHIDHNVVDLLTKAFDVSRKAKRTTKISQSSGPIHLVVDETVYKEWEDRMERAVTTASSLEAEQDSGTINRT